MAANLGKEGRPLYDKQFQISDLFVFFIVPQRLTLISNAKRIRGRSQTTFTRRGR